MDTNDPNSTNASISQSAFQMAADSQQQQQLMEEPPQLAIRQIYSINSKVCLFLGGLLNLTVVWLVLKKTPKEMRVYSKIVLQTCFCDLAVLITGELVQPILIVSKGVALVLESGPATWLPHPWHIWLYNCWFFCCYFISVGIVVQFVYRYLTLCRNMEIRTGAYFGMLAVAAAAEAILLGSFFWIGHPPAGARIDDEQVLSILGEPSTPQGRPVPWHMRPTLHGDKSDPLWLIWVAVFLAFGATCYAIIWFCGIRMVHYVRQNLKMGNNVRAAEVNRQMTRNMIIQASIPMLDILVFMVAGYASMTSSSAQPNWFLCLQMLLGPLVEWIPVLNPLVTIITVSPYRRTLIRVGPSLPPGSTQMLSKVFLRRPSNYTTSEEQRKRSLEEQMSRSRQQLQQPLQRQQQQHNEQQRRISAIAQF